MEVSNINIKTNQKQNCVSFYMHAGSTSKTFVKEMKKYNTNKIILYVLIFILLYINMYVVTQSNNKKQFQMLMFV